MYFTLWDFKSVFEGPVYCTLHCSVFKGEALINFNILSNSANIQLS